MKELLIALSALSTLFDFINKRIAEAKERGELTPEEEVEVDNKLDEVTSKDHWKRND